LSAFVAIVAVGCCLVAFGVGRCGDGNCEGPENSLNCPEDCATWQVPNPRRAIVSEDILGWRNWLEDGGFEVGMVAVDDDSLAGRAPASVQRTNDAARSGEWGVRIETDQHEGFFALCSKIEKGEATQCTLWAKSLDGSTELRVSVFGVENDLVQEGRPLYSPERPFVIGEQWTEVQFVFETGKAVEYALFVVEAGPHTRLDIDDARIEGEQWEPVDVCRFERTVGGIAVPIKPVAPFHFNVLIHIEDPNQLITSEEYFRKETAVFTELARILHEHGGFLTIQPEEDWPMGAQKFAPSTLSDLANDYGVVYSTHTHGPSCIGNDGRLWSNRDCSTCRDCEQIAMDTDPYTPEYVGNLRELLEEVSGTTVSDHNGNWLYANVSALADVGISTWSGFKDGSTQSTFNALFTNPWRPTHCSAAETPETFFVHDPTTEVIFIPGWGQAITRHPERLHERLAAMLGQVLRYADANRVNTFYIVTHVSHYAPEGDVDYIEINPATGEMTYGDAFLQDLAFWEETLSELIDPLVDEGYLQWTSLPEIGELFVKWETGGS
jgi:hypothetical protein